MDSGLDIEELTAVYKLLGDETRLRVLALMQDNELAVGEIQKILGIGQSTLSSQLALLKEQNLVASRKEGQKVFYRIPSENSRKLSLLRAALENAASAKWHERDRRHLQKTLLERSESSRDFFNRQAAVQNMPSPGQTWQALAHGMMGLLSGRRVLDLGCGSGRLARLMASAGNIVTAVDNSEEQIRLARAESDDTARADRDPSLRDEIRKPDFILASMEATGLPAESFDVALLSQSLHHAANPSEVIREAHRLLAPHGRLLVLDLLAHEEDWLRGKFGDFWLGFAEADLRAWIQSAGFRITHFEITPPSPEYPDLEGVLILGEKSV
jgi:ubiquinone/menaquinone biosynthesis C-methylase UbiE/DNA-binding transcriptional ArsR family regulator